MVIIIYYIPMKEQKKLDCVLKYLSEESKHRFEISNGIIDSFKDLRDFMQIHRYLSDNGFKGITDVEVDLMTIYLYENGKYIDREYRVINGNKETYYSYRISYKGKLFIDNGGFSNKKQEDTIKKWAYILNIFIVCVASIVATVYYIGEISKESPQKYEPLIKISTNKEVIRVDSLYKSNHK
ncbi:MAG TPA: hypothetical protein VNX01_15670 [Bacteroidia bacterium]|nr:hypothetical protein [Bacteroidia bacterium]